MPSQKIGKSAKDIFSKTTEKKPTRKPAASKAVNKSAPKSAKKARSPGRPVVHVDEWTKVTVVLFNRQLVWLDRLSADIRAQTGAAVSRTEILRAMVDAVTDSGLNLSSDSNELAIKNTIKGKITGR